ncbi:hypothetical protein DFR58_104121 [Anaerobacterium chartisolvens]|uniref:Uncharacterized protein n=1 Tax=Anaerobacterium chartisolvens TaxID=1297424 RepID=A0A369BBE2_9FIRM|nr:hypothetical protein [Anaerobacterium chartisolvens]RCX18852.1 hypothetical protein DFR58_104121 [Anaerobacterium chartisolvens]
MKTRSITRVIVIAICVAMVFSSYAFAAINDYGDVGTTDVHGHLYISGSSVAAGTYAEATIRYMNVSVVTYDRYSTPLSSSSTVPAYNTKGVATPYISKGASATSAIGNHYADDTYHGGYEWWGQTSYDY